MGKRRNIKATARNTRQIVLEAQKQTAVAQRIEAERRTQQAQHEAHLAAVERERQRQAQREFQFRYDTDPTYRAWVDAQRIEQERQRLLAEAAWAADGPRRAAEAAERARVSYERKCADEKKAKRFGLGVLALILLVVLANNVILGLVLLLIGAAIYAWWRRYKAEATRQRQVAALEEAQRVAALAALNEEDQDWLRRQQDFV